MPRGIGFGVESVSRDARFTRCTADDKFLYLCKLCPTLVGQQPASGAAWIDTEIGQFVLAFGVHA
jgi:hypothetical protein